MRYEPNIGGRFLRVNIGFSIPPPGPDEEIKTQSASDSVLDLDSSQRRASSIGDPRAIVWKQRKQRLRRRDGFGHRVVIDANAQPDGTRHEY